MTSNVKLDPVHTIRLFAYGSLLEGERDHDLLADTIPAGAAATTPDFELFDLGVYPALVAGGQTSVVGEVYVIDRKQRYALDVRKENTVLFHRQLIELADGSQAEAYLMKREQVRGKRRLPGGDWRNRLAPKPRPGRQRSW